MTSGDKCFGVKTPNPVDPRISPPFRPGLEPVPTQKVQPKPADKQKFLETL